MILSMLTQELCAFIVFLCLGARIILCLVKINRNLDRISNSLFSMRLQLAEVKYEENPYQFRYSDSELGTRSCGWITPFMEEDCIWEGQKGEPVVKNENPE